MHLRSARSIPTTLFELVERVDRPLLVDTCSMKLRRSTLLTFDAFGTLITPREPIAKQYADAATRHGLSGFTEHDIDQRFRHAFKEESRQSPNYGKATGLGAARWWTNVCRFVNIVPA